MEAAVFAPLGLLRGFSFAGGTSRPDARRELIVQEANAIGTFEPFAVTRTSSDAPTFSGVCRCQVPRL